MAINHFLQPQINPQPQCHCHLLLPRAILRENPQLNQQQEARGAGGEGLG